MRNHCFEGQLRKLITNFQYQSIDSVPCPQLLRLTSIAGSPLNPLNSQLSRLPHDLHFLLVISPSLQQLQATVKSKRTKRLRRLVSAHIILGAILDARFQEAHSLRLAALAQAVRKLVLQERRRRHQSCGDCFNGGNRLVCGWGESGKVLEREEGAEASGQRRGFGCDDVAQGEDRRVGGDGGGEDGHFG